MSLDKYIDILDRFTPISEGQLSTVRLILEYAEKHNEEPSGMAPWLLAYRPARQFITIIRDTLLDVTGIVPRVPLERIKLEADDRHSFDLLILADSPAYIAYPPRQAMNTSEFIGSGWRGLDLIEGLWLILTYPTIIKERALDLVGTIYSIECTPCIYQWNEGRFLSAIAPDSRDQMCRPVFARKTIRINMKMLDHPEKVVARLESLAHSDFRTPMF